MLHVFAYNATRRQQDLADFCNDFLKEICLHEDFYFLQEVEIEVFLSEKKKGTATRKKRSGKEEISINTFFLMYVYDIFRVLLMNEMVDLEQRCERIIKSLQGILDLQVDQLRDYIPNIFPHEFALESYDVELLISALTPTSDIFPTINHHMLGHPEKFEEWWNLFVVFLILHEVGHILWDDNKRTHKFWHIIQEIIREKEKKERSLKLQYGTSSDAIINSSTEQEVFCDSIAAAACSVRINEILSVEEMRSAISMYGDIFRFLSSVDEIVKKSIFGGSMSVQLGLMQKRVDLFQELLKFLISEKGIWPQYTTTNSYLHGTVRTHVYSTDHSFMRFWIHSPFAMLPIKSRNAQFLLENNRKDIAEVNQLIRQLEVQYRLEGSTIASFVYSDNFLLKNYYDKSTFEQEIIDKYGEYSLLWRLVSNGRMHEYSHSHTLGAQHVVQQHEQFKELQSRAKLMNLLQKRLFLAADRYWERVQLCRFSRKQLDDIAKAQDPYHDHAELLFEKCRFAYYNEVAGKLKYMTGAYESSVRYARVTYDLIKTYSVLSQYQYRYLYDIAYALHREGVRSKNADNFRESVLVSQSAEESAKESNSRDWLYRIKCLNMASNRWLALRTGSVDSLEKVLTQLKDIEVLKQKLKIAD